MENDSSNVFNERLFTKLRAGLTIPPDKDRYYGKHYEYDRVSYFYSFIKRLKYFPIIRDYKVVTSRDNYDGIVVNINAVRRKDKDGIFYSTRKDFIKGTFFFFKNEFNRITRQEFIMVKVDVIGYIKFNWIQISDKFLKKIKTLYEHKIQIDDLISKTNDKYKILRLETYRSNIKKQLNIRCGMICNYDLNLDKLSQNYLNHFARMDMYRNFKDHNAFAVQVDCIYTDSFIPEFIMSEDWHSYVCDRGYRTDLNG